MSNTAAELLKHIQYHNKNYRAGKPTATDAHYDEMVEELRRIDPGNDWFKRVEPGYVGRGRKVKLPIPMKSLYKVKDIKSLQNWLSSMNLPADEQLVITPKFDGISLLYEQQTGQAYSRGGADNEGQDCTKHAAKVRGIMINEPNSNIRYTYGELLFSKFCWEGWFHGKTSPYSGEPYKSPRNTIAGFINRDVAPDELSFATFYRYGVDPEGLKEYDSYAELYKELAANSGLAPLFITIKAKYLSNEVLQECYFKWNSLWYIDGLVIYLDDLMLWDQVGRQETTGNPNYAIAYKNPNFTETFITYVKEVNWKMSKSGAFKPVVNIHKVDTGDCEMENPTGYNARYIFTHNLGPGAEIRVTRSGGVIPKILEVIRPSDPISMGIVHEAVCPCPHCGQPTEWNETNTELCCVNPKCPERQFAKIVHFFTTLGAEQMGEETLRKLFDAGYNTIGKILDITFDEICWINGFGESIANAILTFNRQVRDGVEITYLMHSSDCFQGIGQVKAKKILLEMDEAQRYGFVSGHADTDRPITPNMTKTEIAFVSGIKPFYEFVATNRLTILPMNEAPKATSSKYEGFKVCFTGVRDKELEATIASGGGEVVSGVSKKTTHLVVADKTSSSSKTKKAIELGIPILTISEFKAL